ncbi:MAG: hypothetical protein SFY80_15125 [Verrucomicrobiota bacterium]|nr:hypothetical protein [Verrucomicrobiota bacterium]
MSKELLQKLANQSGNQGPLKSWLENNQGEPRIAWYPSAGSDLRDLLNLHPGFRSLYPPQNNEPEPEAPNFFIHSDIGGCAIFDQEMVFHDDRTCIRVVERENLTPLNLPVHAEVYDNTDQELHRLLFLLLEVRCNRLGTFQCPLLFAVEENAAFCADLLANHAHITHLVQVRYGYVPDPVWIRYQLRRLGVEVLITDESGFRAYSKQVGTVPNNIPQLNIFKDLNNPDIDQNAWRMIRTLPLETWYGYGPVSWYTGASLALVPLPSF